MFDENHMGWKLVKGVRLDVINLFKSFSRTNSVRYEDFCEVWKDMNFSLIFRSRVTFIEILEFTEELLLIVKEYLSSVYEFHTRIAAIFTLYGLYFKQPIKGAAKIRFTKSEWEELYLLMEECKAAKHFDVVFIYLKLFVSGAFTFAATLRPTGLEQGFRKFFEKKFFSKNCDIQLFYKPLINERLVRSLVQLESLYCEKKAQLLGKKNLIFIDGQFAQTLQEELKNYESSLQSHCGGKQRGTSEDADENSDAPTSGNIKSIQRKSRKSKNVKNNDSPVVKEREQTSKKRKPGKIYQELLAKKKAEYYIQRLRQKNNKQKDLDEKHIKLPHSDSESSEDL